MSVTRKRKIECRVTNMELLLLKKKSKEAGITLSEFIRGTALNYDLAYKLTEEEIFCFRQLTAIKNNFQNISNYMKYKANKKLLDEILSTIELVNFHLKKFE